MNDELKETLSLVYVLFQGWLSTLGALSLCVHFGVAREGIIFNYELALGYSFLFTAVALICGVLNAHPFIQRLTRKVDP